MSTSGQLLAAITVLILSRGIAPAQLPSAPQPHLTAAELKKEADRCGVPLVKVERLEGDAPTALRNLHAMAWTLLKDQVMERNSNRKEILARLSYIARVNPDVVPETDKDLILDLQLTLAARKSKPGSIESLIDDLTDHHGHPGLEGYEADQVAFWKLAERGFEAIPVLMDHLDDMRLTRTKLREAKSDRMYDVRVAELCEYMLNKLAAEKFLVPMSAGEWKPPKEQKWWAEARKLGEEKWLMQYVIPEDAETYEQRPNAIILRVIRAKYPQRLKDVYQTVLLKRPKINSEPIAKAIAASKLALKEKIALLEDGIERGDSWQRYIALEWLSEVDPAAFRKQLTRVLENAPANLEERADGHNWKPGSVGLVRKTSDPKCWDALMKACQRVSPETRLYFIRIAGWPPYPGEPDPGRREGLRFLLRFLDAETLKDFGRDDARDIRDLATFQLAKHFAIIDWELDPHSNKPLQSPREISLLRDRVRELAERELAQPVK